MKQHIRITIDVEREATDPSGVPILPLTSYDRQQIVHHLAEDVINGVFLPMSYMTGVKVEEVETA